MSDVVAIGELLIDFSLEGSDSEGYPTMKAHPGGAPANYLACLSKLGARTGFIGKVGSDFFGRALARTLSDAGIDTRGLIVADDVFTTLAFVTLDESGDREFSFARKPGADTQLASSELRLDVIDEAGVLHFGSLSLTDEPSRSACRYAVEYARSRGKLISYDPNLRKPLWADMSVAREQMLWGLTQSDVVKISDEEVDFLFGLSPEDGVSYITANYPAELVFVTCGADGCYYGTKTIRGHADGMKGIKPVDTTGAGDIFGGSAMWMLLRSGKAPQHLTADDLRAISSFACCCAGLSTTRPGGISSIPSREEVLLALERM